MSNLILQTNRLTLRPFNKKDAYVAAYNSRQPSVAASMSDMVLLDEAAGLAWINWINKKSSVKTPWQILAVELTSEKNVSDL